MGACFVVGVVGVWAECVWLVGWLVGELTVGVGVGALERGW